MRPPLPAMLVVLAVGVLSIPDTQAAPSPPGPLVREAGALRTEDVPEIPRRVIDRARRYLSVRAAELLDWRPDGKAMLIGTRFGDTAQVHEVRPPSLSGPSDRQQRTFFTEPVREAAYAGDGGDLWFRMDVGGGEFFQYYVLDGKTGEHRLITDGKSRNEGLLPSPSRKQFAFASTERNGKDYDLYVYAGSERKRVAELAGQWNAIAWSPDEKHLVLRHYLSITESTLHVVDVAKGTLWALHPHSGKMAYGADAAVVGEEVYFLSDLGGEYVRLCHAPLVGGAAEAVSAEVGWDVSALAPSPDGKQLAWVVNEGGASQLWLSSAFRGPKDVAKRARRIPMPGGVAGVIFGTPRFDSASRHLGFTLSTGEIPADVFVVETTAINKPVRWTTSETGGLPATTFVPAERAEWTSFDGRKLSGWLYRPRKPAGKLPVIVSIHGGPESQSTAAFSSQVQSWVTELGVAVLLPNVRGSSGYGRTSLSLDDGVKRMDSVKDIGALLDWIALRPDLDAGKVAVFGGSYGGFMVLASLVAYSERLRCGVDMVGISNFVTFLERTEAYRRDLRRAEYGDERDAEVRKVLLEASPLLHAERIRRPLFVAQGKNDPRVPVGEAEQIVRAVRATGQKVWYMLASDEGHGFQKKPNRDAFQHAVMLFFEEHLIK